MKIQQKRIRDKKKLFKDKTQRQPSLESLKRLLFDQVLIRVELPIERIPLGTPELFWKMKNMAEAKKIKLSYEENLSLAIWIQELVDFEPIDSSSTYFSLTDLIKFSGVKQLEDYFHKAKEIFAGLLEKHDTKLQCLIQKIDGALASYRELNRLLCSTEKRDIFIRTFGRYLKSHKSDLEIDSWVDIEKKHNHKEQPMKFTLECDDEVRNFFHKSLIHVNLFMLNFSLDVNNSKVYSPLQAPTENFTDKKHVNFENLLRECASEYKNALNSDNSSFKIKDEFWTILKNTSCKGNVSIRTE